MFNIPVYCINLKKSAKRYSDCKKRFAELKINIERFEAIDGSQLFINENLYIFFNHLILPTYNTTFNAVFDPSLIPNINLKLSNSEYGCSLSHIRLWKKIALENHNYVIIVEDDVKPLPLMRQLPQTIRQVPEDWDIIYISFLNTGKKKMIHRDIYIPESGWTTSGYIVNTRSCRKLLSFLPMVGPIDVHLLKLIHHKNINAYVIDNICDPRHVWGGHDSTIHHTCVGAKRTKFNQSPY